MWLELDKLDGEVEDEIKEELDRGPGGFAIQAKECFFYKCWEGSNWEDRAKMSRYRKEKFLQSDCCVLGKGWWQFEIGSYSESWYIKSVPPLDNLIFSPLDTFILRVGRILFPLFCAINT